MELTIQKKGYLDNLPDEWTDDLLFQRIQDQVKHAGKKIVVLDDDPTGTQTVHNITVITRWDIPLLMQILLDENDTVYILTNSRSMSAEKSIDLHQQIIKNLKIASQQTNREFVIVSRSDSTLRGHFPDEIDAILGVLDTNVDGILLIPFFDEGGRLTIDDIHYITEGEYLIPTSHTEYAKDKTFGYTHSNLREWVAEKLHNQLAPDAIHSIDLNLLRTLGPDYVFERLSKLEKQSYCVVNAASYRDLEVFVSGLLRAELNGKNFLYRTAASFVRVRGGITPHPLLTPEDISPYINSSAPNQQGLVIVGSHIQKSTHQTIEALKLPNISPITIDIEKLLNEDTRAGTIKSTADMIGNAYDQQKDVIMFTSRKLISGYHGWTQLQISQKISQGIVEVINSVPEKPIWVIAKGGITASDIATDALNITQAQIVGQVHPGIPMWISRSENDWNGIPYIVFPGNVGENDTMKAVIIKLRNSLLI